jgi:hypothetical protein
LRRILNAKSAPPVAPPVALPKAGDIRRVRKFLWLPRTLPDQLGELHWRWFEIAEIEQVYEVVGAWERDTGIPLPVFGWADKKWLD